MYGLLADVALVAHVVFVAFVVFGGLVVLRWAKVAWSPSSIRRASRGRSRWGWVWS